MNVWAMIEGRVWALVVPDRSAEGKSPPRTKRRAPRWRVDGRLGGAKDGRLGGAKDGRLGGACACGVGERPHLAVACPLSSSPSLDGRMVQEVKLHCRAIPPEGRAREDERVIVFVASTPGAPPTPAKGACVTSPRRARVRAPRSESGEDEQGGGGRDSGVKGGRVT